jgi:hypothetical protein
MTPPACKEFSLPSGMTSRMPVSSLMEQLDHP